MVSFELGKEIEKFFFVLSRAWDKEKILRSQEERAPMLYNWATVTLREFQYEVYITFFLHTAGISTVSHARDKTKNISY